MPNSRIILAKGIKMDRDYINTLSYDVSQMLALVRSSEHLVAEASDYSFVRETGAIRVAFTYAQCLESNYIAFQNPNYSNQWFFAWRDTAEYRSDKMTEITFKVDSWSTYYKLWTSQPCYVIRHHVAVSDDVVGRYTQPEGLELGEYVIDEYIKYDMSSMAYIIQVTEWATDPDNPPLATNYGGVYAPGGAYICQNIGQVVSILQQYQEGRQEAIVSVYMCPNFVINNTSGALQYSGQSSPQYDTMTISKPTTLNGYTPVNNKLLTFPYCYLNLSNNSGQINTYMYERFTSDNVEIRIGGVPSVGSSIKAVPQNYKIGGVGNEDEGIIAGKFPTLGWSNDEFINWLTQNSVNIGMGTASSLVSIVGGLATGNIGASAVGAFSIANQIGQIYQHSLVPNTARGNTNGGDIGTCSGNNTIIATKGSIAVEYAQIIDNFLSRYGYKITRIVMPNFTSRPVFNYIQIGADEQIGYGTVPSIYMQEINNACRRGTTIFHSHSNIGNYALNNR